MPFLKHLAGPSLPSEKCWGTGRERTENEYAALLERAGWTSVKTWYPASRAMGVVEGACK